MRRRGQRSFRPKHFESTQGQEVGLRKAANGKEENFMAFQGRQGI